MKKELEVMIEVQRAHTLIAQHTQRLVPQCIPLVQAVGLRLAESLYSEGDVPAFWQSSVDGYAFSWTEGERNYQLIGEVPAGSGRPPALLPKQAVRIFTGAPLPEGADTVVMQERTLVEGLEITLNDPDLSKGSNVRPPGSEIAAGALALEEGSLLLPGSIGFLAGMGKAEVVVYPRPKVAILVTGNELQAPGQPLAYGQVYESNSVLLQAALLQLGIQEVWVQRVSDQLEELQSAVERAIAQADVVLVTGGVSVGDYDFTYRAAERGGIELIFHKIKQKPGKPLLFGHKGERLFFGLPGNPASVLTCFYEYVFPALGQLQGNRKGLDTKKAPLSSVFKKKPGLTQFLKAHFDGQQVHLASAQASYQLAGFATANCLAVFPEDWEVVEAGTLVEIHLLPDC